MNMELWKRQPILLEKLSLQVLPSRTFPAVDESCEACDDSSRYSDRCWDEFWPPAKLPATPPLPSRLESVYDESRWNSSNSAGPGFSRPVIFDTTNISISRSTLSSSHWSLKSTCTWNQLSWSLKNENPLTKWNIYLFRGYIRTLNKYRSDKSSPVKGKNVINTYSLYQSMLFFVYF